MSSNLKNTHHGMIGDLTKAIEEASDEMAHGTQIKSLAKAQMSPVQRTFGRLFNPEYNNQPTKEQIAALAASMVDDLGEKGDGPASAGMAFFGQFIDHDLTLDALTELGKVAGDVSQIENFRTPRFDLDSVYGSGPGVMPFLYGQNDQPLGLIFGTLKPDGSPLNPLDLQRNRNGRAITGDPRNDENLFVSQLHGRQFVQRHNELLKKVGGVDDDERFKHAQAALRREYQHRVIDEFLPAVVSEEVLKPLVDGARAKGQVPGPINWTGAPDMPVEYSAAAFRFGHSMIRQSYALNEKFTNVEVFSAENMGFSPIAEERNLDLGLFFGSGAKVQRSRAINTKIVPDLISLPPAVASNPSNLAERNMLRGQLTFRLPFGEALASELFGKALEPHPKVKELGLTGRTPLWFYILWEAENNGGRLGPLGGTLVAGTILNLMLRDEESILRQGQEEAAVA